MGFKCGIVGLPNIGKSALFNALTQTVAAQEANYMFSTVESNIGDVAVPDARLDKLAEIAKSAEIVPTRITFVDIAGLVRAALPKAKGWATGFSPPSAKWTPSCTCCAASRTTTSCMSKTASIR